jgi:hypothetical protein
MVALPAHNRISTGRHTRRGAERQSDHDPGDHPPVPPVDLVPTLGGTVTARITTYASGAGPTSANRS